MDLITKFMNLVATPTALMLLSFVPPFYICKLLLSCLSSLFPEDMTNKVVLITGASSGLGEHMAYQYARKGAFLVLIARREKSLREVARRAMALGSPDALVVRADVGNPDDCRKSVDAAISHFGQLNHLVTNAGIVNICMLEEVAEIANFTQVMDINFWGSVYTAHFALPHLRRTRGRIVVNSSAAGWAAPPRMSFYNASKAALITFYETLRAELGSEIGITIATPGGWVESEMTQGKFLSKDGVMVVDQEIRDSQLGPFPVWPAAECAKAVVDAACRGERYVSDPAWFRVMYLEKVFEPEVLEWCFRLLMVPCPGRSSKETLNKEILDASGAKNILYTSSMLSPEIKRD